LIEIDVVNWPQSALGQLKIDVVNWPSSLVLDLSVAACHSHKLTTLKVLTLAVLAVGGLGHLPLVDEFLFLNNLWG